MYRSLKKKKGNPHCSEHAKLLLSVLISREHFLRYQTLLHFASSVSAGRVVNVASMSGRMGCPSQSAYCVSKYGVEAFSDCLRYEMKAWGVKVSVIEPGNFLAATSIMTRDSVAVTAAKLWREAPTQVQEDYGKARFEIHMAATRSHCNTGQKDAASVLDDITDAVVSKRPYTRYHPMEPHSWLRVQLMTHLPGAMSDFLYF